MFKVPEWGDDVPKSKVSLGKVNIAKKRQKKEAKPALPKKIKKLNVNIVKNVKQNISQKQNISRAQKRKHNGQIINKKVNRNIQSSNIDTDKPDEGVCNAKKKKFNKPLKKDDVEHSPATEDTNKKSVNNKVNKKKEVFKKMLQEHGNRTSINVKGNKLRDRMLERLKAAQFRYINEKLYTSSGTEAKELFQNDPAAFQTYHEGYQLQVKKWPVNPLDVIVKRIQKMPKTCTVADMGCGEAALSKRIPQNVRSFDLVSTAPGVEICDIEHTPLLTASVDVAVYCLALMGTNLTQYLIEANRVLKEGGHLLIAEVESRFDNVEDFTKEVLRLGFKLKKLDKQHKVFFFMEFVKIKEPPAKKAKLPFITLKPCLYKRR